MQKNFSLAAACVAAVSAPVIAAPPLTLRYSRVNDSNGAFRYSFVLTLDDPGATWAAGDGYGWIIFGDQRSAPSPFQDWIADPGSLTGGPWSFLTSTSGYNNGLTLGDGRAIWIPLGRGESVTWSGTTHAVLTPADIRWSCLLPVYAIPLGKPRGPIAEFELAVPHCRADFDHDGFLTGEDFDAFVVAFQLGAPSADFTADGFVTGEDFDEFVAEFVIGC